MKHLKVGDKIFSPENGFLQIEGIRGNGSEREVMFTILDQEYWIKESIIQG